MQGFRSKRSRRRAAAVLRLSIMQKPEANVFHGESVVDATCAAQSLDVTNVQPRRRLGLGPAMGGWAQEASRFVSLERPGSRCRILHEATVHVRLGQVDYGMRALRGECPLRNAEQGSSLRGWLFPRYHDESNFRYHADRSRHGAQGGNAKASEHSQPMATRMFATRLVGSSHEDAC